MTAVVGVIPAAGYATRLRLQSGSKEVLTVRGRPLMDHLVERMRRGGATRLRVVTRPAKEDVVEHARRIGAEVVLGEPPTVGRSLAAGITGLAEDDLVLFGFPDTIWSPVDGFARIRALVEAGARLALGVFESPHPERADVAVLDHAHRVVDLVVKSPDPPSNLVYAAIVARVDALDGVDMYEEPGGFLAAHAHVAPLPAARLGRVIDLGTPESFANAEHDVVWSAV